jgi:hypothetical protein
LTKHIIIIGWVHLLDGFCDMTTTPEEIENVLETLTATPHRLISMSEWLADIQLRFKPDEESWSANDILAHLRACADVWGKSIMAMITQNHPTMRYVSPRTWMKKTNYLKQEFHSSLEAFINQRNELINTLRALEIKDWSRGATFTATIKGREQTVLSYARRMAQHESDHCNQIEALLKETRK